MARKTTSSKDRISNPNQMSIQEYTQMMQDIKAIHERLTAVKFFPVMPRIAMRTRDKLHTVIELNKVLLKKESRFKPAKVAVKPQTKKVEAEAPEPKPKKLNRSVSMDGKKKK